MTAVAKPLTGASSASQQWKSIDWKSTEDEVFRLQMRIAKAIREGRHGRARALQWLLTHPRSAKLIAVKRVVQNKGGKTPGVDNNIWTTPQQKWKAAQSLKRKGYKTLPLKRIYIPKKDGRKRPLSIPAMKCRAMQALYLLALQPISEMLADKNSYGFRPKRSTADAVVACHILLSRKCSPQFVFEADIRSCFDKISHEWLRNNIPMDKEILNKWLAAGYIDEGTFYRTELGTPQGGIASPTLLVMTLSGLEEAIGRISKRGDKIHAIIYADDFIITGASKEVLEKKVKPVVESFLRERGLELSEEKTKITHIDEGFDFLGVNIRKYKGKLLTRPLKKGINNFVDGIRKIIKTNPTAKTENLIQLLNPKIRGWANHFRYVCAKKAFRYIDHCIFEALWLWVRRRYPKKVGTWRKRKYFRRDKLRNWIFFAKTSKGNGAEAYLDLFEASYVPIKRHTKIRAKATSFDPKYQEYLSERESRRRRAWVRNK